MLGDFGGDLAQVPKVFLRNADEIEYKGREGTASLIMMLQDLA